MPIYFFLPLNVQDVSFNILPGILSVASDCRTGSVLFYQVDSGFGIYHNGRDVVQRESLHVFFRYFHAEPVIPTPGNEGYQVLFLVHYEIPRFHQVKAKRKAHCYE